MSALIAIKNPSKEIELISLKDQTPHYGSYQVSVYFTTWFKEREVYYVLCLKINIIGKN